MTHEEFVKLLEKAFAYWKKEKDYIPVYDFHEWMRKEFDVIYNREGHRFFSDRGKLMFVMRWG